VIPTLADLRNAVESLLSLPDIGAVLQLNSPTMERAFEAYVFSLIVHAVRRVGSPTSAVVNGIRSGPNPATVVMRGSPGRLGSTAQDFAYASCQLGGKEFEIHADVQYEGSSHAVHEIDVSIYDHDAADRIRQAPQAVSLFPSISKLVGAVECKFYDSDLGTALGRTFVGLTDDCGTLTFKLFVTNGQHNGLASYFAPKKRPMKFFRLSPSQPQVEEELTSWLASEFRKWTGLS
jgi:hypothetical protein